MGRIGGARHSYLFSRFRISQLTLESASINVRVCCNACPSPKPSGQCPLGHRAYGLSFQLDRQAMAGHGKGLSIVPIRTIKREAMSSLSRAWRFFRMSLRLIGASFIYEYLYSHYKPQKRPHVKKNVGAQQKDFQKD